MKNIILFGPPGSGKGTQADLLKKECNFAHISTGDIFRKNIQEQTSLGIKAKSYIDKGSLVPDELTIDMLESEYSTYEKSSALRGIILDGFPRTKNQAIALDSFLLKRNEEVTALLNLEVKKDLLLERLLLRGKESLRSDDLDDKIIESRIEVYLKETLPVSNYYQKKDKLFVIPAQGTIEEVSKVIKSIVNSL